MKRPQIVAFSALALVIFVAVLFYSTVVRPGQRSHLTLWNSTEHDVKVRIDVIRSPSGELRLSGTFTPLRQKFYLYSKELPRDGLNGLGRPTLLEVIRSDSIELTGPLEADRPVQNIYVKTLDLSFPVYPVGPVTLSLPFELAGNSDRVSMEIAFTYMTCSDKTCLPPVIDKHAFIEIPASFFDDERR